MKDLLMDERENNRPTEMKNLISQLKEADYNS